MPTTASVLASARHRARSHGDDPRDALGARPPREWDAVPTVPRENGATTTEDTSRSAEDTSEPESASRARVIDRPRSTSRRSWTKRVTCSNRPARPLPSPSVPRTLGGSGLVELPIFVRSSGRRRLVARFSSYEHANRRVCSPPRVPCGRVFMAIVTARPTTSPSAATRSSPWPHFVIGHVNQEAEGRRGSAPRRGEYDHDRGAQRAFRRGRSSYGPRAAGDQHSRPCSVPLRGRRPWPHCGLNPHPKTSLDVSPCRLPLPDKLRKSGWNDAVSVVLLRG